MGLVNGQGLNHRQLVAVTSGVDANDPMVPSAARPARHLVLRMGLPAMATNRHVGASLVVACVQASTASASISTVAWASSRPATCTSVMAGKCLPRCVDQAAPIAAPCSRKSSMRVT